MSEKNELLSIIHDESLAPRDRLQRIAVRVEAAAPEQEVEPVYVLKDKLRILKMCGSLHVVLHTCIGQLIKPASEYAALYLSPPTAEQAAADMKRRCIEVLQTKGYLTEGLIKYIEALPTSDTAMEEMRRDAERWQYWLKNHGWSGYFDDGASNYDDAKNVTKAIDAAIAAEKYQTEPK